MIIKCNSSILVERGTNMKRKTEIFAFVLVFVMLVTCLSNSVFAAARDNAQKEIDFTATLNERLTETTSKKQMKEPPNVNMQLKILSCP